MYKYILLSIIGLCFILNYIILHIYSMHTIIGDGIGYYMYLPSTFIWHTWSASYIEPHYTFCVSDIHKIVIKYPMGVSILMFPFFILSHIGALLSTTFDKMGFSLPYRIGVNISTLFYYILGSIFCYKAIVKKFSENIALTSITAVTLGCGMVFYTIYHPGYSHIYSFCLISIFIYLVIQEKKYKEKTFYYILMGILLGLIFLVRHINILIAFFWIFYDTNDFSSFKTRLKNVFLNRKIIASVISFIAVLIPQMIYWKAQTGHFIVNTYNFQSVECYIGLKECGKEGFDFLTPHFINNLFSLRKGLFVYYPVMIFAVLGLFKLKKYYKEIYFSTILFLAPVIYLICAWHEWWYGFSIGQRVYIDYMSIFAILIASALNFIKEKTKDKNAIVYKISIGILFILAIISLIFMYLIIFCLIYDKGSLFIKEQINL